MAIEIKIDIWRESSYTIGVSSSRYDRAVRYARVRGLTPYVSTGTSDIPVDVALRDAGREFIGKYGKFHHLTGSLPLAYITLKRWGPATAWIYAEYQRRGVELQQPGIFILNTRDTTWAARWWRLSVDQGDEAFDADGLPNGSINGLDPTISSTDPALLGDAKQYSLELPATALFVRTQLNYHPQFQGAIPLQNFKGKINDNVFQLPGITLPRGRVRFDGVNATGTFNNITGLIDYDVLYQFLIVRSAFYKQGIYFGPGTGPGVQWPSQPIDTGTTKTVCTIKMPAYPLANFPQFPVG